MSHELNFYVRFLIFILFCFKAVDFVEELKQKIDSRLFSNCRDFPCNSSVEKFTKEVRSIIFKENSEERYSINNDNFIFKFGSNIFYDEATPGNVKNNNQYRNIYNNASNSTISTSNNFEIGLENFYKNVFENLELEFLCIKLYFSCDLNNIERNQMLNNCRKHIKKTLTSLLELCLINIETLHNISSLECSSEIREECGIIRLKDIFLYVKNTLRKWKENQLIFLFFIPTQDLKISNNYNQNDNKKILKNICSNIHYTINDEDIDPEYFNVVLNYRLYKNIYAHDFRDEIHQDFKKKYNFIFIGNYHIIDNKYELKYTFDYRNNIQNGKNDLGYIHKSLSNQNPELNPQNNICKKRSVKYNKFTHFIIKGKDGDLNLKINISDDYIQLSLDNKKVASGNKHLNNNQIHFYSRFEGEKREIFIIHAKISNKFDNIDEDFLIKESSDPELYQTDLLDFLCLDTHDHLIFKELNDFMDIFLKLSNNDFEIKENDVELS